MGGLTILKELVKLLPQESIIYLGDTARLPYGDKSPDTVIRYAKQSGQFLLHQDIKILVIACHTASSHALQQLEADLPIPVLGVTSSGIQKALQVTTQGRIAVLGTRATIQSGVYQRELIRQRPSLEVHAISCPLFVPLVEERYYTHPATELIVHEYLAPLRNTKIDTVILGCTHYPMLAKVIQGYLGPSVTLIDCGQACAEALSLKLSETKAQNSTPTYQYFVTDDPQRFQRTGEDILGQPLERVQHCVI